MYAPARMVRKPTWYRYFMKKGSVMMRRFACFSIFKIVFGEIISSKPKIAVRMPIASTIIIFFPIVMLVDGEPII